MTAAATCAVCSGPVDDGNSRICHNCERPFHLRLVESAHGEDCGEVWINEQYLSLEFACNKCLGNAPASVPAEPPIGSNH